MAPCCAPSLDTLTCAVQGLGGRPLNLHELASIVVEKARDDLKLHVVNVSTSPIHQTAKFEDQQHARNAGFDKF